MAAGLDVEPSTFVDVSRWRAVNQRDDIAYRYLSNGETETARLTYGELDRRAQSIAAVLQSNGLSGERALLVYPPGLEFVTAFFGCLYAGTVAIPAPPPRPKSLDHRLALIIADADVKLILTHSRSLPLVRSQLAKRAGLDHVRCRATDEIEGEPTDTEPNPILSAKTVAFLQYTSGSTLSPRGVIVSHGNLLHNSALLREAFGYKSASRCVSWLPLHHDMGLIGGVLQPMFGGFPCTLMAPSSFLERPIRWLQAISVERATISGAPNFGYDLCASRIAAQERSALDLSSWEVAFNGAEPIHAHTLDAFAAAFVSCGFRKQAFSPCYGLAEATLIVSGKDRGKGPLIVRLGKSALREKRVVEVARAVDDSKLAVGCGRVLPGQQVIIVHPESFERCGPDSIGEIWVSGPSVACGYWNRRQQTEETFRVNLARPDGRSYLRTGDLGFLHQGELFIAGRLKDTIIIRGNNHWPQDIESTMERAHPGLRCASGAAFTIEVNDEERLVVVQEVKNHRRCNAEFTAKAIRQAIAGEHGIQACGVVLVKAGSIPKTSSGKVQRQLCREKFRAGRLDVVFSSILPEVAFASTEEPMKRETLVAAEPEVRRCLVASYLRRQLAEVLGQDLTDLDPRLPFTALGLDSLRGMELRGRIEYNLGLEVPITKLIEEFGLEQLTKYILDRVTTEPAGAASVLGPVYCTFPLPASFEQERLWLLDQLRHGNPSYAIGVGIRLQGQLELPALQQSIDEILRRHAVLRTSFTRVEMSPVQVIAPAVHCTPAVIDLRDVLEAERARSLPHLIEEELRTPFDLSRAPLLRLKLVRIQDDEHILVLAVHHIIADAWSLRIFVREFMALYRAFAQGLDSPLREVGLQYADFVLWQRQTLQAKEAELVEYWRRQLECSGLAFRIPTDQPRPAVQRFRRAHVSFEVSAELADGVRELARIEGTTVFLTLLAAFKMVLYHYSGRFDVTVGVPIAGRTRPEVYEVIGMFAYPLVLLSDLSGDPTFREILHRVRRVALAAYEHQALPFSRVVQASRPERQKDTAPLLQTVFSMIRVPDLSEESDHTKLTLFPIDNVSPDFDLLVELLEESAGTKGKIEYDAELFHLNTISALANAFLRTLATCVRSPETKLSACGFARRQEVETNSLPVTSRRAPVVAVCATFTGEPIQPVLAFWAEELDWPYQIALAPYGQVFQELLNPNGLLSRNHDGINVLLLKLDDLHSPRDGRNSAVELGAIVRDLIAALKASCERSGIPHVVCICPPAPANRTDLPLKEMEQLMRAELEDVNGLVLITGVELETLYPVSEYYDPRGVELGHIPYQPVFFAALGTIVARKIYSLRAAPPRVIVLDCDETLWKGVCAEDGLSGIEVDSARKALQNVLIAQQRAGVLLCLCSKNNESDVLEIFDKHPGMVLNRSHLATWRMNWNSKAENIKSIAAELHLGLDAFVFIDDDPLECMDVKAHCPEVLTLRLPSEPDDIPKFLSHVWVFDRTSATQEDKKRTVLYQQEQRRRRLSAESPTFESFLRSLELEVRIAPMALEQATRVSQLTERTNQFNTTKQRRSPWEIGHLYESGAFEFLVVEVSDRFGDYGLVGAVAFKVEGDAMRVDSFLLSCRVLGRGVEHRVGRHLGKLAKQRNLSYVEIPFIPTARNRPALDFLNSVGEDYGFSAPDGFFFRFPADSLNGISLISENPEVRRTGKTPEQLSLAVNFFSAGTDVGRGKSARVARFASELRDPEQILREIEDRRLRSLPAAGARRGAVELPRNATERRLSEIWGELLGTGPIGIHEDFFSLGGHSLLATQALSRISQVFGVDLPVSVFFDEAPTIANLGWLIENQQIEHAGPEAAAEVLQDLQRLTDQEVRDLLAAEPE